MSSLVRMEYADSATTVAQKIDLCRFIHVILTLCNKLCNKGRLLSARHKGKPSHWKCITRAKNCGFWGKMGEIWGVRNSLIRCCLLVQLVTLKVRAKFELDRISRSEDTR